MRRRRVVIVQKSLTHYRVPFFDLLRERCAENDIDLAVVYGDGVASERSKGDIVDLEWGTFVPNRVVATPFGELVWQPVFKHLRDADLVVVEQANKLLLNYVLQARRGLGGAKLAFWGHGKNFQQGHALAEAIKRLLARRVDWWFAYNEASVEVVRSFGMPGEAITNVQNAIDTRSIRRTLASLTEDELARSRAALGGSTEALCVYCGGLYGDKRLGFLFDAAERVRAALPHFRLAIIGDGPDRPIVERAAEGFDWVTYLGPLFDREKVAVFRHARLQLMPGLVGLGILDSFAMGVPLVTTDIATHSPEIDYLRDGRNGLMTEDDPEAYAEAVVALLLDADRYERLRAGARRAGEAYTVESMAERFAEGLQRALAS